VLRLYADRVEIAAGRYETTHPRRRSPPAYVPPEVDAAAIPADTAGGNDRPRVRRPTGSGPISISPSVTAGSA
jgi:hypothetical protein